MAVRPSRTGLQRTGESQSQPPRHCRPGRKRLREHQTQQSRPDQSRRRLLAAAAQADGAAAPKKRAARKKASVAEGTEGAEPAVKKAAAKKPAAKRGRKAKADKGQDRSADFDDADLSDIDEELRRRGRRWPRKSRRPGREKVKPLRMKVSKAKERALMKEFGLDETVLTEEEAKLRRESLKKLIKIGKTRGYLTHARSTTTCPTSWSRPRRSKSWSRCSTTWAWRSTSRPRTPRPCCCRTPARRRHRGGSRGGSRSRAVDRRQRVRPHHRPGAHVHARDGHGRTADARGRDRDRQTHRERPARHGRSDLRVARHHQEILAMGEEIRTARS